MKIFGTIYPFVETGENAYKLGRHVANYEFFKALLSVGNFDEFHLFCLSVNHLILTKNRLQQESLPENRKKKIQLYLFNNLKEKITTTEYHVFHLGGWGYFFPGLVYFRNAYAKNKFPITGLIHSLNGIETNYHAFKICTAPLLPYDTIICSSNAGKKVLDKVFQNLQKTIANVGFTPAFKGNTEIIPLGIDARLLKIPDKSSARQRLSLPTEAIIFLTIGRLSPQTKADLYPLLKTFQRVMQHSSDKPVRLIIAGGANNREIKLVREIIAECGEEHSVHLITNFSDALKPYLYGAADVYISLSDNLQETFGISVIEAMAAGLPAVVSDINGYSELVTHGSTGYKIPTLWTDAFQLAELSDIMNFSTLQLMLSQCMVVDTEALYNHLLELVTDTTKRRVMGEEAKKKTVRKYLWTDIIASYESLWSKLHEQSVSYTGEVSISKNPFANDYLYTFSHYPTGIIGSDTECSITPEGRRAVQSGILPVPYTDISSLLDNDTITEILSVLLQKSVSVADILEHFSLKSIQRDNILYMLLWLAKYSLIHLKQSNE